MKRFKVITLFPEFFESPLKSSLLGKAIDKSIIDVEVIDLRKFSTDKFGRCDDYSYGGGSGMVMKPEPLDSCLSSIIEDEDYIIYLTPSGNSFNQNMVKKFTNNGSFVLICGHYEGIDQRIIDKYVDIELSVGDFVLSGGEPAALLVIDSISRYEPGFMSNSDSLVEESFEGDLLEYPHYTRPSSFMGIDVPDVLLGGNHAEIRKWRKEKALEKTRKNRPDLYEKYLYNQRSK